MKDVLIPSLGAGFLGYLYAAVCLMVIAQKLGADNAWWAWIPILNLILFTQIAGKSLIWILPLMIPFVNIFFFIPAVNSLAEKLGKPGWVGFLLLIPLTWPFMPLYLAFL